MRSVPCILLLVCLLMSLTGCSLFRGQSSGDAKRWWFSSNQNQPKKSPSPDSLPNDDPLLKSVGASGEMTMLAGQVIDPTNTPMTNAYVRWSSLEEGDDKQAPIDVAVRDGGYFEILGLKKGKKYKLEARAKQGDKLLARTQFATAPNVKLVLQVKSEFVTADTPPLPPPPGPPFPMGGLPQDNEKDKEKDRDKSKGKENNPASTGGWGEGSGKPQNPGSLNIGPPIPLNAKPEGGDQFSSWDSPLQPPAPPKYPFMAEGPHDPPKPPLVTIPHGKKPEVPPPPPYDPSDLGPGVKGPLQGAAHVPSCVMVGNRLINFALRDFYGSPWEWKSNRLGKLVLLDFWRTNCPPCLAAIDNLRLLQAKYGPAGLEIIGIAAENKGNLTEQRSRIASICQVKQTNYRILLAGGGNDPVLTHFAVYQLPTLVLLDEQGNILWRHEGGLDKNGWDALDMHIQMKLAK